MERIRSFRERRREEEGDLCVDDRGRTSRRSSLFSLLLYDFPIDMRDTPQHRRLLLLLQSNHHHVLLYIAVFTIVIWDKESYFSGLVIDTIAWCRLMYDPTVEECGENIKGKEMDGLVLHSK